MNTTPNGPDLFHFRPEEKIVVDRLAHAIRRLLIRPDVTPRQVHECGVVLHALQRLPLVTEGVGISVTLIRDYDSGKYWFGLTIDEERVEFDTGESVYGEFGSDNDSRSVFLVTADGRSPDNDLGAVLSWARGFAELIEAESPRVDIEDFGDSQPNWNDEGDPEWWNELPDCETEG